MAVGNLEVILPPAKWYPDLDNLPQKWGDKPDRAKYVITVNSYAIGHFTEYPTMHCFWHSQTHSVSNSV